MSEQARTALQEKIKNANKNIWVSLLPLFLGINSIIYGVLDLTLWHHAPMYSLDFMLIILGIACVMIGISITTPHVWQYNRLKKELESIATSFSNCPNCRKEISQGNFEFCPFCGNSLKNGILS